MRIRRFASLIRPNDEELAMAITPLISGVRALRRDSQHAAAAPVDADTKLALVRVDLPSKEGGIPVLDPAVEVKVKQILDERRASEKLAAAGLVPIRSVLMSGPPGVGKTMTAGWLARELELPLYTLDLASVMSSFLGRTGANVRAVLNHAQQEPCVLLLDEFDSIAKRRDDDADVGELKRLVTVILQTIDDWSPMSLLVAATNHGELLDPAVWRRFDETIQFSMPNQAQRAAALRSREVAPSLAQIVAVLTEGQTMSAITRAVDSSQKQVILNGQTFEEALIGWALAGVQQSSSNRSSRAAQRDLQIMLMHSRGHTAREIAAVAGVSHTTVLRTLNRSKETENGRT